MPLRASYALIVANSNFTVEIYVPTHRLAEEWRDKILACNPHKRVTTIRGRAFVRVPVAPSGPKAKAIHLLGPASQPAALCPKYKLADEVSKAGMAVYPNLCKRGRGKGISPVKCQHYDHCDYLGQFHHADVYIYTHAHLALERGVHETWRPALVIIDESFFQSLIEKVDIPMSLLRHASLPIAARGLCDDVAKAITIGLPLQARFATALGPGGDFKSTIKALKLPAPVGPADTELQQRASLRRAVSFEPVHKLLQQLAVETQTHAIPQSAIFDSASGSIVLHHRRRITRFNRTDGTQPTVHALDASASELIIGQFFEIQQVIRLQVQRIAYVVQCHTTRCSTASLVPSKNSNAKAAAQAACRIADLTSLVAKLAANGKKVLVVGPIAVVGNPKSGTPSLVVVPAHCELAHFNALRGVDHWKDFDIVVIVGRNEPPAVAVENMARALFFDNTQPLELTGTWDCQMRGYRIAGGQLGVDTVVHADARIQAIVEQLREQESLQAIDRLRLMRNQVKKTVIVLSNVPLDIDVDEARTWEEIMHGSRLEQAWDACAGVLPLNPLWLAANYPTLWVTPDAAKLDVRRARKKGHLSNISSIRTLTLFEFKYRQRLQRQWSTCLSASNDARHVQGSLELMIGVDVVVRPAPEPV